MLIWCIDVELCVLVLAEQAIATFLSLIYSYSNLSLSGDAVPDEMKGREIRLPFPMNLLPVRFFPLIKVVLCAFLVLNFMRKKTRVSAAQLSLIIWGFCKNVLSWIVNYEFVCYFLEICSLELV